MFGLGYQELLVILVIVLVLFGAKRLPELARSLGWMWAGAIAHVAGRRWSRARSCPLARRSSRRSSNWRPASRRPNSSTKLSRRESAKSLVCDDGVSDRPQILVSTTPVAVLLV